jgi:hypothetical protein
MTILFAASLFGNAPHPNSRGDKHSKDLALSGMTVRGAAKNPIQLQGTLWSTALFFALASISIVLFLWPVINHAGWPHNHEFLSGAFRITIYSSAMLNADLLPIWLASDVYGMGSAMPLLYHKLFSFIAATFYILSGSLKLSVILTLALLGYLGIFGLYKISIELGARFYESAIVSIMFPHLNYSVTDWLIRGAFSEYAALCLTPYLIWWSLRLVTKNVFGLAIAPILILLFLAHSIVAFYAMITIGVAFLAYCLCNHGQITRTFTAPILASLLFAVFIGPILALMIIVMKHTNHRFLHMYKPTQEFQPFSRYLFDSVYHWGLTWRGFTVQLDIGVLLGILVALALWLFFRMITTQRLVPQDQTHDHPDRQNTALIFILLLLMVYLILQLPISAPVYEKIPGMDYIQFPWRLLGFISVLSVTLFTAANLRLRAYAPSLAMSLVALVSTGTIVNNVLRPIEYQWFTPEEVENPPPSSWPEYWPLFTSDQNFSNADLRHHASMLDNFLQTYASVGIEQIDGHDCTLSAVVNGRYLQRTFQVACTKSSIIALPITYSGLELVQARDQHGWKTIKHYRTESDPRVRISMLAGSHQITVLLPTLPRVIRSLR